MEESYTVHRRRKAAARKREKTPNPSPRSTSRMDTSDDEDEERRARMERMAEEAERMEQQKENRLTQQETPKKSEDKEKRKDNHQEQPVVRKRERGNAKNFANVDDMIAIRAEVAVKYAENSPKTRETDAAIVTDDSTRPIKQAIEVINKSDNEKSEVIKPEVILVVKEEIVQETPETLETPKEATAETTRSTEVRKMEKRLKRKSKERVERYSRSTDSSDMDERNESNRKRTKSPEAVRTRPRKTSGRSKASDTEAQKKDAEKLNREKRSSSRQKLEDTEPCVKENFERQKVRLEPHSQIEETDEEPRNVKKSDNFPQKLVEEHVMKRSSTDLKKQIIPLSNDSLIEDLAKAQKQYLLRERGILDPELADMSQDVTETNLLKRRKHSRSLMRSDSENKENGQDAMLSADTTDTEKNLWFSWLFSWRKKKEDIARKKIEPSSPPKVKETETAKQATAEKVTLLDFLIAFKDVIGEFKAFVAQNPRETMIIRRLRNRCIAGLLLVIIYCGLGAFVFRFVEGAFETFYKCGVKRVKRDFLDTLWNYSHNLREDDWKSMARRKLMEFEEQLHTAHEAGVHSYSGQKSWSFLNAVGYCLSVITTIGYGHISPSTNTGRAITIVYAIFGIPMFLIILADFGKLFTRGIKFLWAFVRRLYYTGSCRKVRRTVPVQEVMKGVQLVYDLATFRRPSQMNPQEIEEMQRQQAQQPQTVLNLDANAPETPGTPALSAFAIDDEFNLPISVAIFILLGYIFIGATLYYMWEDWGFFESFYFVFISMSTIGFGDYVPKNPIYMMCSIVYLVFGLALTSMCINVVQVILSDSFKQASQKIGATIGLEVAEDDNSVKPASPPPVEVADVHTSMKESESGEKIAPKAKQEDVDL